MFSGELDFLSINTHIEDKIQDGSVLRQTFSRGGVSWLIPVKIVAQWQMNRGIYVIPAETKENAVFAAHLRPDPAMSARINFRR